MQGPQGDVRPSQRRRILHFSESSEPGGAETVLLRLVEGFSSGGWDSIVVLMKDGWLHEELRSEKVPVMRIDSHRSFDIPFLIRLIRAIRGQRVNLVHAHLPDSNAYAAIAGAITGVPVIATYHGMLDTFGPPTWTDRIKLRIVGRLARRIVAVSESMHSEFLQRAAFPSEKTRTVYNGIDWSALDVDVDESQVRRGLGISATASVIGMVGAVRPVKGHVYAFRALKRIKVVLPETHLLIIGQEDAEYRQVLLSEMQSLGVTGDVTFLGFRSDISHLLKIMDVFIMPSLSEGHPLATIEAMGAGVPIVVSAVGGHPEFIDDGQSGYLVPSQDDVQLAERVLYLLNNVHEAREMAEKARVYVRERFSLELMLSQYESLYLECLDARGGLF